MDNIIATSNALGFTLPTPAYLVGMLIFSLIGIVAYYKGKASKRPTVRWLGLALMLFPYAVSATVWLYVVGIGLSGAAWYYDHQG